jgi:peptidylprolyl isomerase
MLAPTFSLDHKYPGIGRVISGMQFVDQIAPGEPPAEPTKIVRAWLDGPLPAAAAAPAEPSTGQPQVEAPAQPAEPKSDEPKESPVTGG